VTLSDPSVTRRPMAQLTDLCLLPAGEDEIDWDDDDNKATTAPAAAAVAAGGLGQVANPTAVPNQKVDTDPSTTTDLKVVGGEDKKAADGTTTEAAAVPEVPKQDFSIGLQQTDAEKEAAKRAERAKRFQMPEDEEEKKKQERAKKFGLDAQEQVVKGLDSALPERRQKRGREDKQGGRSAKRQTPDRRTGPPPKGAAVAKKPVGRVTDDPSEKAKAEARAKRFQNAA
jgi:SAP domain-containing ribonucleoprotein